MASRLKLVALNARALGAGVLTAVLLVAGYTYIDGWRRAFAMHADGNRLLVPVNDQVCISVWMSLICSVIIAACCSPFWLWLEKRRLASGLTAVILGFAATMLCWLTIDEAGGGEIGRFIVEGLPYAISGAVAGLVTWSARPRICV